VLTRPPNSDLFKLETNSQHTIPVQLCASHVVSPRDLWLRVLPRWQLKREREREREQYPFTRGPVRA
jgi:hypothetical protein